MKKFIVSFTIFMVALTGGFAIIHANLFGVESAYAVTGSTVTYGAYSTPWAEISCSADIKVVTVNNIRVTTDCIAADGNIKSISVDNAQTVCPVNSGYAIAYRKTTSSTWSKVNTCLTLRTSGQFLIRVVRE